LTIEPRVDAVFIHVSNVARSARWYADFLGVPIGPLSHEDLIAEVPVTGETKIILDGHAHARGIPIDRQGVRLMFPTADLDAAISHSRALGTNVTDLEDIGSAIVFYLDDPDGNRICVIWRKPA